MKLGTIWVFRRSIKCIPPSRKTLVPTALEGRSIALAVICDTDVGQRTMPEEKASAFHFAGGDAHGLLRIAAGRGAYTGDAAGWKLTICRVRTDVSPMISTKRSG